ncbi:hypothetical protein SDC9_164715 [bioreactor metagenome]|uniref:Uncharacterized protein n=1 Tax=bioreactor metagenome TaxID=1076179 RepID=A0A645FUN9_9ZZZZ
MLLEHTIFGAHAQIIRVIRPLGILFGNTVCQYDFCIQVNPDDPAEFHPAELHTIYCFLHLVPDIALPGSDLQQIVLCGHFNRDHIRYALMEGIEQSFVLSQQINLVIHREISPVCFFSLGNDTHTHHNFIFFGNLYPFFRHFISRDNPSTRIYRLLHVCTDHVYIGICTHIYCFGDHVAEVYFVSHNRDFQVHFR